MTSPKKRDEGDGESLSPTHAGEMTTLALGEEQPGAPDGDEVVTTLAVGEEQAPARPVEPTKKKGEDAVTTLAVGEESPGADEEGGNPFGRF
jgi:hypothetical protein